MIPIWTANSLSDLFKSDHPDIFGISFDTRSIKPGDIFFALKGVNDGHDFVQEAIEKGASCAIVERHVCSKNIIVNSAIEILVQMAKIRRKMLKSVFVGITGSVGKTTSKQMLAFALNSFGKKVFATEKSYNNLLGVAFSLAQIPLDVEFAIIELGTNNFGEIAQLAQLCDLDYSLITDIAPAHINAFKTLFNIAQEKGQIINYTSKYTLFKKSWYTPFFVQLAEKNDIKYDVFDGMDAYSCMQNAWKILLNKLVVEVGDFEWPEAVLNKIDGRRNVFDVILNGKKIKIIDSIYNANLASMIENLKFLQSFGGKKIAILGDMLAIGKHARRYHEILSCYLGGVKLLAIGDNMKFLCRKLKAHGLDAIWFENMQDLVEYLERFNQSYTILVKGSSDGYRSAFYLGPVVDFFKQHQ